MLKQWRDIFLVIPNANSIVQLASQIKHYSNQKLFKSKNCHTFKEDCGWNPSTCICKNDKYLKSIVKLQQSRVMKDIKILILIIFSKMKNPTEIF